MLGCDGCPESVERCSRGSTVGAPAVALDKRIAEILMSKNDAKSLAENGLTTAPGGCSTTLSRRQRVFESSLSVIALRQ